MGELFAELDDIVTIRLENLEKGAQMRRRLRRAASVKRVLAMHEVVYAAAQIFGVVVMWMRMVMQVLTSRQLYAVRRRLGRPVQKGCRLPTAARERRKHEP